MWVKPWVDPVKYYSPYQSQSTVPAIIVKKNGAHEIITMSGVRALSPRQTVTRTSLSVRSGRLGLGIAWMAGRLQTPNDAFSLYCLLLYFRGVFYLQSGSVFEITKKIKKKRHA